MTVLPFCANVPLLGLEERCNNLMMEKFGRLVDFEAVQVHSVNIPMEQMKVRIMEKEYEHFVELKEWEVSRRKRRKTRVVMIC